MRFDRSGNMLVVWLCWSNTSLRDLPSFRLVLMWLGLQEVVLQSFSEVFWHSIDWKSQLLGSMKYVVYKLEGNLRSPSSNFKYPGMLDFGFHSCGTWQEARVGPHKPHSLLHLRDNVQCLFGTDANSNLWIYLFNIPQVMEWLSITLGNLFMRACRERELVLTMLTE